MGVAIGSGIFRTPGEIAAAAGSIEWILLAWLAGGLIVLVQGLVSSELATRFPEAGGEYVFLRQAYGDFAAFFFGWAYTIFIIGGGAATIALAFGDFAAELFNWQATPDARLQPGTILASGALLLILGMNALGLRSGAGTQNLLTALKILAMLGLIAAGLLYSGHPVGGETAATSTRPGQDTTWLLAALLPALWAYEGTTDSIKLSGEIKDVQRAIPRAVIGATLSLMAIYLLVNYAFLRVLSPAAMAGQESVPGAVLGVILGQNGRRVALLIGMLVCLGSLSSTILATVRVTYALAVDRFAPEMFGRMSRGQAPIASLLLVTAIAIGFVCSGNFGQVMVIYFFAAAILFGMSYGSLLIFRARETERSPTVFRCPGGRLLAILLIAFQAFLAWNIMANETRNWTDWTWLLKVGGLLAAIAASYLGVRLWRFKSLYG